MVRMLGIAVAITAAAISATAMSLIGVTVIPSAAVAQENAPLAKLADLVVRKGYKDKSIGQLCDRFGLRRRVGDGDCKGFAISPDDDDKQKINYPTEWTPAFYIYFEQGTAAPRVILITSSAIGGFAFLTAPDGELQKAAAGRDAAGHWQWSAVAIDGDLRGIFAREISTWLKLQILLEGLPDRKDR